MPTHLSNGKSVFLPSFLSAILILTGCAGEDDDSIPTIDTPTLLEWSENQNFTYQISADGAQPLEYILANSVDAHLFEIDSHSGVLSSDISFDFEAPIDADKDGLYELNVIIIGDNNKAATQDIIVKIVDAQELSLPVSFPAPNSNFGGKEGTIQIRGKILDENKAALTINEDLTVMVNGENATAASDNSGNWLAPVELKKGSNEISLQLFSEGVEVHSSTFVFNNEYAFNSYNALTQDGTHFYSLDLAGEALIEKTNSQETVILLRSDITETLPCPSFSTAQLLDGTNYLALGCDLESGHSIIILDLSTKDSILEITDIAVSPRERLQLVANKYLLVRRHGSSFTSIDIETGTMHAFNIEDENQDNDFMDGYFVDGSVVHVPLDGLDGDFIASFDLLDAIENSSELVTATPYPGDGFFSNNPVVAHNGIHYFISPSFIDVIDSGSLSTTWLTYLGPNPSPLETAGRIELIYQQGQAVVLKASNSASLVLLDLPTGSVTPINSPTLPTLKNAWQSSIHPEHTHYTTYDSNSKVLYKVDLGDYTLQAQFDTSDVAFDQLGTYGQMDYDFTNDILYRHRVISWGGVTPDDSTPLLLAYDTKSHSEYPLIDATALSFYFGEFSGVTYRLGETVVTDDPNILWFTALTLNSDGNDIEGVYSFNVQNFEINTIWEFENTNPEVYSDDPYLSQYSSLLRGVILTEWNDGYVSILNRNGEVRELVSSFDPYWMTHESDIDEQRELIYFDGFYQRDEIETPDYDRAEILEYDLSGESYRLIASKDVGIGLPFRSTNLKLDENRQNLITPYNGQLLIIDTYTGDRVLKAVE